MKLKDIFHLIVQFDWDKGNIAKNWEKHKVHPSECEDIFFNKGTLFVESDSKHSIIEQRYSAFGKTDIGRLIAVVFTIRNNNKIRIISARDMNKKEKRIYHEKI